MYLSIGQEAFVVVNLFLQAFKIERQEELESLLLLPTLRVVIGVVEEIHKL
jgi:hypothetical protein